MKKLIFILILLVSVTGFSQTNPEQIFRNLKNGAILVRLTSKSKTINAVKDKNPKLAERIAIEQKERNQEIVNAFNEGFTLCPVYYFYDFDSRTIRNGNFKNVLLDKELNSLTESINLLDNYLIAEFGETKGDSIHLPGEKILIDQQGKIKESRDTSYVMYDGYDFKAVVLFTPDFVSVQRPFPRYARKYIIIIPRTSLEMVQRLQAKIEAFLYKSN